MDQKRKFLVILALIFGGLGLILILQSASFGKLRFVACNVGQGDGMLIISPGGHEVVVDGGGGNKILDCLGRYMPFWDRTIELVILTHPQADHMEGLIGVLKNYKVRQIMTTGVENSTQAFGAWKAAQDSEGAKIVAPGIGDIVVLDPVRSDNSARLVVLWPGASQIASWKITPAHDLNETAIVLRLEYGGFCEYLTADIPKEILQKLVDKPCPFLKVAHHGSKTGTNQEILDKVKPTVAVIQVGKNSFGHPHKEVLDLLVSKGIRILRNDTNGTIEVVSDERSFKVKTDN